MTEAPHSRVLVIGAGPIGLELAVGLQRAGIDHRVIEKGSLGATIGWFPEGMTFFSSNDRIAIADVPIENRTQGKTTKEDYLAYLRAVARTHRLQIQTHEKVQRIEPSDGGPFRVETESLRGPRHYRAGSVVLAIGDTDRPHLLNIPGENLPQVSHYFKNPHDYYGRRVLIVGGKNSAAEAALRCHHAGARVTLSYRREAFRDTSIKYWLLPELLGRIERGEIDCHYETVPVQIEPGSVRLESVGGDRRFDLETDFVLLLTGYEADSSLFRSAGVQLDGDRRIPFFDPKTMMTNVPGLYVAGTATAGTQNSYKVFLENCHIHVDRILASLQGEAPPPDPEPLKRPES